MIFITLLLKKELFYVNWNDSSLQINVEFHLSFVTIGFRQVNSEKVYKKIKWVSEYHTLKYWNHLNTVDIQLTALRLTEPSS